MALVTALRPPGLVRRGVLTAGVFHHDGWLPGVLDLDEETTTLLSAGYAEVSPDGPEHYPVVAAKQADMHEVEPALTAADLGGVRSRTLVMVGDDDEMPLEHAVAMYEAIPDAELAIVPGTSHGLLAEKPALCNGMIVDFLANDPVPTYAPIRRALAPPFTVNNRWLSHPRHELLDSRRRSGHHRARPPRCPHLGHHLRMEGHHEAERRDRCRRSRGPRWWDSSCISARRGPPRHAGRH